jgi:hypothetical protein
MYIQERRERKVFARLLSGGIIKRYKMQHMIQKNIGFSAKRFRSEREAIGFQKSNYMSISRKLARDVEEFFLS